MKIEIIAASHRFFSGCNTVLGKISSSSHYVLDSYSIIFQTLGMRKYKNTLKGSFSAASKPNSAPGARAAASMKRPFTRPDSVRRCEPILSARGLSERTLEIAEFTPGWERGEVSRES